jgi:PPOX class probable F420-dependent enzyme
MRRMDVSMSPDQLSVLLALPLTGALATLGPGGFPHQSAMWFVPGDEEVLMWTYTASQKSRNLQRDRRASLLVEVGTAYGELRGMAIQGEVEMIRDPELVRGIGLALHARYNIAPAAEARSAVNEQLPKRVGLRLPMTRVVSWDHRKLA